VVAGGLKPHREALLGVKLTPACVYLQGAVGDDSQPAPLKLLPEFKDLGYEPAGFEVSLVRYGSFVLVFHLSPAAPDLAHYHENRLKYVKGFKAGDNHRFQEVLCKVTVGFSSYHGAYVTRTYKGVYSGSFHLPEFGGVQDVLDGGRR